ncbi:MAG: hypothetical protein FJW23_10770 [Acidimicrobiia bacterium]|nr:hypothetical protein [Acidimicrobiia bacterium]
MARVDAEMLGDRDLLPIFIAATMAEARLAEEVLTQRGVHFVVQAEHLGYTLFGSPRHGATFYVEEAQVEYCVAQLTAAGLDAGVIDDAAET